MFRLGACVEMMKITRGLQSWFVMATFIQAWYVWVGKLGLLGSFIFQIGSEHLDMGAMSGLFVHMVKILEL